MNQKREVDTRTAQLLVCSAVMAVGPRREARTRGSWSRLLSFMVCSAGLLLMDRNKEGLKLILTLKIGRRN